MHKILVGITIALVIYFGNGQYVSEAIASEMSSEMVVFSNFIWGKFLNLTGLVLIVFGLDDIMKAVFKWK